MHRIAKQSIALSVRMCGTSIVLTAGMSAPRVLAAQVVTVVRVAESGAKDKAAYRDAGCSAESKRFSLDKAKDAPDTLIFRIEDDRNALVKPGSALSVRLEGKSDPLFAIPTDSNRYTKVAEKRGDYVGKVVTLVRETDKLPVCSVLLKQPTDPTPEDTARRAFRVGVGASFDFLSGASKTDLYYDVTAFVPRIWKNADVNSIGIDMGLYNGRTVSQRDTVPGGRIFYFSHPHPDSSVRIRQHGSTRRESSEDRLGVYAAPTMRLAPFLYLAFHAELIKRSYVTKTTISVDTVDTNVVVRPTGYPTELLLPTGSRLPDSNTVRRSTEFESYFGMGPIVQYLHSGSGIELRLKPMLGAGIVNGRATSQYVVQGRVTDFDNGLKLGAEVRGLLTSFRNPTLIVYLAKDFGLKRLADFVVGGDDDGKL